MEDNETDVLIVREVLKNCGLTIEATVAKDGAEALECLKDFVPRLILLDLNLPKLSGFEVLTEIRRRETLAQVPVVVVTSSKSASDYERAQRLQAAAYFSKPGELTEYMNLGEIVRTVLAPPEGKFS